MNALRSLLLLGLMSGLSQAATITVSSGLPAQGFLVTLGGVQTANHLVSVGNFNAGTSTFSSFGSLLIDTDKVNGVFAATSPTSFNGTIIDVFVGLGTTIEESMTSGNWVVIRTNANTTFPADVSGTGSATFAMTLPTTVSIIGEGNVGHGFATLGSTNTINFVPEPSTALLGALGVFGLLRRRRR